MGIGKGYMVQSQGIQTNHQSGQTSIVLDSLMPRWHGLILVIAIVSLRFPQFVHAIIEDLN